MRAESRATACIMLVSLLAACAGPTSRDRAPSKPPDVSDIPDAVPRAEPRSKSGNPPFYEVMGKRYYVMKSSRNHVERGVASWYGQKFHGRTTSSGEVYDMYAMTAAHKTLPLPTYARVTNLKNGRSIVVKINDRGPFIDNRIIDLSYTAAVQLDMITQGTAFVEVETLDPGAPTRPTRASGRDAKTASPSPRPTPTRAAGSSRQSGMFVQVGAFSQNANAIAMAERLKNQGIDDVVIRDDLKNGRTIYRVRVGPVTGVEHYDRMVARMADLGIRDAHLAIE